MQFLKEDMSFTHYRWGTDGSAFATVYSGEPSRRPFDPFNGNQVLYLINYFATIVGEFSHKEGKLIENQIAHHLPAELKSERSVFNWLLQTTEGLNKDLV